MNEITVSVASPDSFSGLLHSPVEEHEPTVQSPCLIRDESGQPIVLVTRYEGDLTQYRRAVLGMPVSSGVLRAGGYKTRSQVFGFLSRNPLVGQYGCSTCAAAAKAPDAHRYLCDSGHALADMLTSHLPDVAAKQHEVMSAVLPEWRLPGGMWTSGVVNDSASLPYHFDKNNLDGWSAMVVVRRHTRGGHLHLPQIGHTIRLRDGDTVFFCGYRLLHGVTPISYINETGYRMSSVYYPVAGIARCLSWDEEVASARRRATEAEQTRLAREREKGWLGSSSKRPAPGRACEPVADLRADLDFREPQYRREVFHRFYTFHLKYRAHPGCVYYLMPYLRDSLGWDDEEALWFAAINGNTQNPATSLILHRRFPRPDMADALGDFFSQNHRRLPYDTDRRHQKQRTPDALRYYAEIAGNSQSTLWGTSASRGFSDVWLTASRIPGFGRLSTFSYTEYLRITGIDTDCDTLFIDDIPGSRSHRNGLAIVTGRDDLDWHASNTFDGDYTADELDWLTEEGELLLSEARIRNAGTDWEHDVSYFTLESALCTYKSWHRPNRRYPNVYNDMLVDRIRRSETLWPDDDHSILWQARQHHLPQHLRLEDNPADPGVTPEKQNHYLTTGQVVMMDEFDPVFRNDLNDHIRRAQT